MIKIEGCPCQISFDYQLVGTQVQVDVLFQTGLGLESGSYRSGTIEEGGRQGSLCSVHSQDEEQILIKQTNKKNNRRKVHFL